MTRSGAVVAFLCIVVGTFVVFSSAPCMAQRVWVGGGGVRVRAPFVRVDVYPYGGVSVRAPFAAVDVPPRGYYYEPGLAPPVIFERPVEPSFPTAADLAAMDAEQLAQALQAISQSLHNRLRRFDTGDTWQRYLRLPDTAIDMSLPPEERMAALAELLNRLRGVAADPQYPMIARLPAFNAMEAALNEAVARPETLSAPADAAVEDLPLPAPEQPPQRSRNGPFLQPKSRQ